MSAKTMKFGTAKRSRPGLPLFLLAATALVAGCEQTKRALGQTKNAPDEFAVYQRAPLSLPPNYSLRPPTPGQNRPQTVNPRDRASAALGQTPMTRPQTAPNGKQDLSSLSSGEISLLRLIGALDASNNIRNQVNQENTILADGDKGLTDTILFWQKKQEFGIAVDAAQEKKRIQRNQAAGLPLNTGDTPVVMRKKKALLEGVFR
ncbi:MAG: DUF3035 domain-containing protein [Pseudomonadota bacterium]|nr:DUF3035 domain-containing protein [Pseudomonadota bacterium]